MRPVLFRRKRLVANLNLHSEIEKAYEDRRLAALIVYGSSERVGEMGSYVNQGV